MINTKRKAFKHTSKYKLKGLRVDPSTYSTAKENHSICKTRWNLSIAAIDRNNTVATVCNLQPFGCEHNTLGAPVARAIVGAHVVGAGSEIKPFKGRLRKIHWKKTVKENRDHQDQRQEQREDAVYDRHDPEVDNEMIETNDRK
jgi:hypothetical protein